MKCKCILTGALLFCAGTWADEPPADHGKKYRLFAGGDTLLSRWFPAHVYEKGPSWPFSALPLIRDADIAFTNLECVISTRGSYWDKRQPRPYHFRAPPLMLEVLTAAGFDLVMTANNHAMDFGPAALLEQLQLLGAANIVAVGSGRNTEEAAAPKYVKVGDMVLAFIGLTTYEHPLTPRADLAGVHWINTNPQILERLSPLIAEARKHADLVIFSPHWGVNWTERPPAHRVDLAHALIDLGVDAILGHSAHQLHGIEIYEDKPIVYDMGNLLWDLQVGRRGQWSAGFLLDFDHSGFTRLTVYPLHLLPAQTVPAKDAAFERVTTLIKQLSTELDPAVVFEKTDQGLVIDMNPEPRSPVEKSTPAVLYEAGRRTHPPKHLRMQRNHVLHATSSAWVGTQPPIPLARGIEFLGARVPEAVHTGSVFAADVALKVSGPLEPGWQGTVKGVRQAGGDSFTWSHPIANGNWMPEIWSKNETGVDLMQVRPPALKEGTYDLYWRLENPALGEVASPLEATAGTADGFIPIGEIWVGSLGVPRGASGISWSGQLDVVQRLFKKFDITKEVIMDVAWPGGAAVVLALLVAIAWHRRIHAR